MTTTRRTRLTQRDEAVLLSLLKYRYLTTSQVRRLHFPSAQTAGRRLRRLRDGGYIVAMQVPGVDEDVKMLSDRGTEAVAATLGVTRGDLECASPPEPSAEAGVRQWLAVGDFRIALTVACRASSRVKMLGFIPGHYNTGSEQPQRLVHHVLIDRYDGRTRIAHDPDAVFALDVASACRLFFLEFDRAISPDMNDARSFAHLVDFYENLRTSGAFQRYLDLMEIPDRAAIVRVLVVAPTDARARRLVAYATSLPPVRRLTGLFWIASRSVLKDTDILNARWYPVRPGVGVRD
jgi:hypothetical protein